MMRLAESVQRTLLISLLTALLAAAIPSFSARAQEPSETSTSDVVAGNSP